MTALAVGSRSATSSEPSAEVHRTADVAAPVSRAALWTGRTISALPIVFLLLDGAMKLVKPEPVVTGTVALGYSPSVIVPLGITLLACTLLYALPRTGVLGAILLTGYLGGAVATHVRVGNPVFSHVLFPTYLGAMIWAGLYLRDRRLRALVPFRTRPA
jgi:hypothetical protein